jgi:hypothetical protein
MEFTKDWGNLTIPAPFAFFAGRFFFALDVPFGSQILVTFCKEKLASKPER